MLALQSISLSFQTLPLRGPLGDLLGQPLEFALVDSVIPDHSPQPFFGAASAEALDDLTDPLGRPAFRSFQTSINVGAAFQFVSDVALLFEPLQNGASRRLFDRMPPGKRGT